MRSGLSQASRTTPAAANEAEEAEKDTQVLRTTSSAGAEEAEKGTQVLRTPASPGAEEAS